MAKIEYLFKETAAGLRRNGILAFAAMLTATIALFLFGMSLLIAREFELITTAITKNVEVQVYLTDPVNPDTVGRLTSVLQDLPAVETVEYWDKDRTCAEFEDLFANQPIFRENVDCRAVIPTSLRIQLADIGRFEQITAAMGCDVVIDDEGDAHQQCDAPGVRSVADYQDLLRRLESIRRVFSLGVFVFSIVMLVAAVILVANTLRMGMFARRKEIGIMRLVGATNWRIRMPFLVEGLVEALLGAATAIVGLFVAKVVFIDPLRNTAQWLPLVQNRDMVAMMPWLLIAAALVALIAGTIGMRRFLDV
jgi:cell division transport system permease protein